jgi:hypothetical protein
VADHERRKDGWDKAAIVGGFALPVVVAAVGAVLTWFASRAQAEFEEINTRTAQVSAVASLLDSLTTGTCEAGGRKSVAIRLVYHVLDDATANDVLLAVGEGADTGCAAVAVQVFQTRIAEFAPELAAAQEVLLGGDGGESVAGPGRPAEVSTALREVVDSPFASLVLPAVLESAMLDGDRGSDASAVEVITSDDALRFARRSPLLATLGDAFVRSERGETLQIDRETTLEWERAAPAATPVD